MRSWTLHLDRGVRQLSRHRAGDATLSLQRALASCPPDRSEDLHRICFFLGVALLRLGHSQAAVRSWLSCQRLRKRGNARRMLERLVNGYGMARQGKDRLDDWKAFLAIQLSRYLATRRKRAFSTDAERDMVTDLIRDYWQTLASSGELEGRDCQEKQELFKGMRIVFPTVVLPGSGARPEIAVDFRTRRRLPDNGRCPCGSGLPYALCHGRTVGTEEFLIGSF